MVILSEQLSSVGYRESLDRKICIDTRFQTPNLSLVGDYAVALKPQPQWQRLGMLLPRSLVLQRSYYRHDSRLYHDQTLQTSNQSCLLILMRRNIPEAWKGCVGGGGGRSEGGVFIISWKLSSVAGSFEI